MFVCPVPKISQVMMKWRRRASHLGRFTLWHNGRRATQLGRFTLWPNRAAETFERWKFWEIQQTQIYSRPSENSWSMYTLRRFSRLFKDDRFEDNSRPHSKRLKDVAPVWKGGSDTSSDLVEAFLTWANCNSMSCNPNKCKELVIKKKGNSTFYPVVRNIPQYTTLDLLGWTFQNQCRMTANFLHT